MNKLFLILVFLVLCFQYSFCQNGQKFPSPEIRLVTINFDSKPTVIFTLARLSVTYANPFCAYEDWEVCYHCDNFARDTISHNVGAGYGFDIECDIVPGYNELDNYGYGLYRFYNDISGSPTFYLDFRDNNYSQSGYAGTDIYIRYNYTADSYEIKPSSLTIPYTSVSNEELITIWKLYEAEYPVLTSDFPNFWSSCLVMVKNNNHPYLIWGAHPTFNATSYKVYRSATSNSSGKYVLIATTNSSTFDFVDNNTSYSPTNPVYYYVKAYNGSYSSATNTISTPVNKMPKSTLEDYSPEINDFQLIQNYPNPFNPSTSITYQLPKKGHVTLKVYNTLGKEVAELVNKAKEEGVYSVTFNGDNLPSGMYFYKINIGASTGSATESFVDVKKMMLLK